MANEVHPEVAGSSRAPVEHAETLMTSSALDNVSPRKSSTESVERTKILRAHISSHRFHRTCFPLDSVDFPVSRVDDRPLFANALGLISRKT